MPLFGEIEQHRIIITWFRGLRCPLSFCEAADAVPVFDLEQGYSGTLFVTSRVEVYVHPPIFRASVQ